MNLENKHVLIVGGGIVALRKIEKLIKFKPRLMVVAPKVLDEITSLEKEHILTIKRRKFIMSDLRDKFMVVVATDDIVLQKRIYKTCLKKKIHCNSVDSKDYCTFLFPSLILKEPVVIGINTSGEAPSVSKYLRQKIEDVLPPNLEIIVKEVSSYRKIERSSEKINDYTRWLFSSHI
ncbi:MAG: bifunctional precorrin-2 dehydrogenase/sirohydrochlorin ferrochelatase [Candidatus Methanomethylicia archaeon]